MLTGCLQVSALYFFLESSNIIIFRCSKKSFRNFLPSVYGWSGCCSK